MSRIIAGTHRGRTLRVPTGTGTRPTSDRAREGLFSSLHSLVELSGCAFLDLYAGSGALGLEALSRGAAGATLVESDPAVARLAGANADALGLTPRVVQQRVEAFLAGPPAPYDVVVLDPPYADDVQPILDALPPWLAPGAVIVVERATRGEPPHWPQGLAGVRSRRYGEATLHYGERL